MSVEVAPVDFDAMAAKHMAWAARRSALPDDAFFDEIESGDLKLFRGFVDGEACVTFALGGIDETLWLWGMGGEGPAWRHRHQFLDCLEMLGRRSDFRRFGLRTKRKGLKTLSDMRGMMAEYDDGQFGEYVKELN